MPPLLPPLPPTCSERARITGLSKLLANARALAFAAWTFTLAVPLFVIMVLQAPLVMLTDKYR